MTYMNMAKLKTRTRIFFLLAGREESAVETWGDSSTRASFSDLVGVPSDLTRASSELTVGDLDISREEVKVSV